MKGAIVGIMVAIGVVLGTFAFLFAQGAPTAPAVAMEDVLTPGTTQTVNFAFQFGFYSIASPNTVWGLGMHLTYSVVQTASNGVTHTVTANSTVAPVIESASGSFYTMGATEALSLADVCSGSACAGVTENVTVTATASIITPYAAWFSPQTVATFNQGEQGCTVSAPCEPVSPSTGLQEKAVAPAPTALAASTFYAELLIPLTVLVGLELLAGYAVVMKHPALAWAGVAALAFAGLQAVVFGVL